MPPKPPEKGTRVISSFFKPKTQSNPPQSQATEILILDSDDDDDDSQTPPAKRVKLEHTTYDSTPAPTPISPIASTSRSIAAPLPPPPATHSYARLQKYSYVPPQESDAPKQAKKLTKAEQDRRDLFMKKVGTGAMSGRKRSSYLEDDHYLAAANHAEEGEGGYASQDGMDEDQEEGSQPAATKKARGKKDVKGKGRAIDEEDENDQDGEEEEEEEGNSSSSRFSRFAAKGTRRSSSTSKRSTTPTNSIKYTPLEQQVIALKKANPGVLLAVEVGYKYKFFEEDAQTASKVLNIACFPQQHMLTSSIPTHRIEIHTRRLLNAGHKVGIVRQIETAALKKVSANKSQPFTRALTSLYTSATFVDELGVDSLGAPSSSTATLMCLVEGEGPKKGGMGEKVRIGLIAAMPSTGEIVWDEFEDGLMRSELETRMLHLQPSELLLQKDLSPATESMVKHLAGQHNAGTPGFTSRIERIPKRPNSSKAISKITEFYAESKKQRRKEMKKVPSEIVLGDTDDEDVPSASQKTEVEDDGESTKVFDLPKLALIALSSLITHLSAFNLSALFLHTSSFTSFSSRTSMTLNGITISNLELLRNSTDYKEEGSLIRVLDKCKTSMGKRLLRKWISKPLVSVDAVNERLDAITEIHSASSSLTLSKLRELLKTLPDLERGLSRIHFGRASPNELLRVLEALRKIGSVFDQVDSPGRDESGSTTRAGGNLKSRLLKSIVSELPKIRGIVKGLMEQVNQKMARDGKKEDLFENEKEWPELQECKKERDDKEEEIQEELRKARKVLKKPALQFKQVALEEYLLEVKVTEKNIVPADWLRINGTKTYYRFRSPSLQKKIQELEQARELLAAAANAAYLSFLQEVASHYAAFRSTITALSTLDCLFSLALVALSFNYVRPTIVSEAGRLEITDGRHPIIEQVSSEPFVANSVEFREGKRKQMILTGLNMGGKSSLSKSIALIALMAQIGSFVPAEACTTSLFDGIYTRMGASDSLVRGRSTFVVELTETSEILKLATPRSLIILDELGRGTSTNDGEAIASAVLEWIATTLKSTTIFVTHYPNLGVLEKKYPRSITTNHMSCLETPPQDEKTKHQDITFLYKLVPGLASASHGLNVARLAGLPESVLDVALEKRKELEMSVKERVEKRKMERLAGLLRRIKGLQVGGSVAEEGEGLIEKCKAVVEG